MKFEKEEANYIEKFKLEFEKEWQKEREEKYTEQLSEYQGILDNHDMQIRKELSNQLRRLNITHSQFPEKYRQLFNEARETFFKSKTDENITNDDITQDDNILQELELMFSHVKNLVFCGFSFDGAAQTAIEKDPNPDVRIHMAHINPDVAMDDLLKETPTSQLFTVFGSPRTELNTTDNGEFIISMEGVDIYNPVDNTVNSAGADKVAAWFIDSDYNGRDFCITQAFFPDKKAWDKIARDLRGVIDPECFEKFSGTESLPFPAGEHACVADKVIDPRGNEVMRLHNLRDVAY